MRRFAVVSCLLLAVSLTAPFDARVADATKATPIERIPILQSNNVSRLSSSSPGQFKGVPLTHGLQFKQDGSTVQLNLNGAYTEFVGTAYGDSVADRGGITLVFQDVSNPSAGVKELFTLKGFSGDEQHPFKVNVRGVKTLLIIQHEEWCCITPVADLVGSFMGIPPAPPRSVLVLYPTSGAVTPAQASTVFLWHGFPGAAAYLLHIWLVKQSGTTVIGPATRVFLSQLVFGHTSYTWNDRGFLPGTYQYDLLPLDRYGNALAGRSPSIQFTLSQGS